MNLQCYMVYCLDDFGNKYEVGVMTADMESAKNCAENSLLEGRNIKAKAYKVEETDRI